MNKSLKYVSRIKDDFDTVICAVNGVITHGDVVDKENLDTLIKMYQSGKRIALASNLGMRVKDLFVFLKQNSVPMSIFYAIITAGEIAHFYLKNKFQLGKTYYSLLQKDACVVKGLDYHRVNSVVMADFILAETGMDGIDLETVMPDLEQALNLNIPLLCIGNDTLLVGNDGIKTSVGTVAEQYAMMGGKIIPFGKPDIRIASYLTEGLVDFETSRCLFVCNNMATDVRMGNNFKAQTLLLTTGVHNIKGNAEQQVLELSASYGLNVDYYMEKFQW